MGAFHAYDIRGVWNADFDADTVYRVGRCLPGLLGADRVLVGRDARASSPELFAALSRGLAEAGADVDDVGLCTTPATYWLCAERGYAAAVMITASHNAKEYNGLKISRRGALPVGVDSGLKELEAMIAGGLPPKAAKPGAVRELPGALDDYVRFQSLFAPDIAGLKVVFDCSNGVGALVARRIYGDGAAYLNEELDGSFPNHPPNPLLPEATAQLSAEVARTGADLGVIFDGDADRVAFVDETGAFVRPDTMIAVLAEHYLEEEPGARVLCDIRTSRGVTERVSALGGEPHLWKVGHAFAKVRLRELGAACGGELAGHYYFRDFHNCDSAMLCASIVLGRAAAEKRAGRRFYRPGQGRRARGRARVGGFAPAAGSRPRLRRRPLRLAGLVVQRPQVQHRALPAPHRRGEDAGAARGPQGRDRGGAGAVRRGIAWRPHAAGGTLCR